MKVLIVEDNPNIARQIAKPLNDSAWQTEHAYTASDAREKAKVADIDLIIMDRMLPDGDGLDVVENLRAQGIESPILVLTALSQTENKIEGYKRGADDYLSKPFSSEELMARVGALIRRSEGKVRTDLKVFDDIEIHVTGRRAHRAGKHLALSPKEFDLLYYFMDNANAIVTREMLLTHVWKLSFDPGTNVIDVNVGRLRKKLEFEGSEPILHTIRGAGFLLGHTDRVEQ
jgi:two-component system OmpR family response regulator